MDEVTYLMPSGAETIFTVQTQRPTVGVLGLTHDNLVIVTRQFRPGPGAFVYELPGGYLDTGDDPVSAALRELSEETGFTSTEIALAGTCFADSYSAGKKHCVLAKNCVSTGDPRLEPEEFIEIHLFPLPEFHDLIRSGTLMDIDLAFLGLAAADLL